MASSQKKNHGHSPIVNAKQILNWRNTATKALAIKKRKKSPTIGKSFKRVISVPDTSSSSSDSSEYDDSDSMLPESSEFDSKSESDIEELRHNDSKLDDIVCLTSQSPPKKNLPKSPRHFKTPQKQTIRDADLTNDCPKRPIKPKRVSTEDKNLVNLKPTSLMISSYSDYVSGNNNSIRKGEPVTSTPILNEGNPKFTVDLSELARDEGNIDNVVENAHQPFSPRTRRRILEELPDKYPICKLDSLQCCTSLPATMTILKNQVQFLRNTSDN